MSHAVAVARNAALLMLTNAVQKLLSFVAFAIIADLVGKQVTGEYFHIVSITSIFVAFTDLGLTSVIIRESAQAIERGRVYLGTALKLKALLIPVSVIAALLYGWNQGLSSYEMMALIVSCLVMTADTLSMMFYGVIRGQRDLRFESFGLFLGQCLSASIGIFAAYSGWGAMGLIAALLVASAWNMVYAYFWTRKLRIAPDWSDGSMNALVMAAIPFGLSGVFVKIYSYIDSQIIHFYHGDSALGEYAVAYKLTYALQFLPMAFVAALYPSMSHAAKNDREQLPNLLMGSLRLMMFFGIGMSVGLSTLASIVIPLVFGEGYVASIAILQILSWVLIPIFLDFPLGSLLNATHRAAQKTVTMGIAMLMNAIVNMLLIPKIGAVGAAWSANASFITLYLGGLWFCRNDIKWGDWFGLHVRGLVVAVGSIAGIILAKNQLPVLFTLMVSPLIVALLSIVVGLVAWQDMRRVSQWLLKKAAS